MKSINLDDGETAELRLANGAVLYVSAHEHGGFRVISETPMMILPRSDNSIHLAIEPAVREKRKAVQK